MRFSMDMARPRSMIKVVCQNHRCRYYLKEVGKDIIKSGRYRTGHQRYYCMHCKTYFMETKGTPLYRKRLTEKEIADICKYLIEKNGIRSIERITGHHRDTIGRLLEDLAEHAEDVNEKLIRDLNVGQYELDEMWITVKKSRRKLSRTARIGLKKVMSGHTPV